MVSWGIVQSRQGNPCYHSKTPHPETCKETFIVNFELQDRRRTLDRTLLVNPICLIRPFYYSQLAMLYLIILKIYHTQKGVIGQSLLSCGPCYDCAYKLEALAKQVKNYTFFVIMSKFKKEKLCRQTKLPNCCGRRLLTHSYGSTHT